jgi:hypothetical protein
MQDSARVATSTRPVLEQAVADQLAALAAAASPATVESFVCVECQRSLPADKLAFETDAKRGEGVCLTCDSMAWWGMRYGTSPAAPRWPACSAAATSSSFGTSSDHSTTPSCLGIRASELSVPIRRLTVARARPRRRSSTAKSGIKRRPCSRPASNSATAFAGVLPRNRAKSRRAPRHVAPEPAHGVPGIGKGHHAEQGGNSQSPPVTAQVRAQVAPAWTGRRDVDEAEPW